MFSKIKTRVRAKLPSFSRKTVQELQTEPIDRALKKTIGIIGSVFGNISSNLNDLDEKTKTLRTDCRTLLESAGGQNESTNLLFRVADTLEEPTQFLGNCIQKQTVNCELMHSCGLISDDLLKKQTEMIDALAPLKSMLVFFKIEASQLSEENRQTFHSVSEEIAHLHVLVDETFQKNIVNLGEARSKIRSAETETKTERAVQQTLVEEKRKNISHAILELRKQVESNSQKSADIDLAASNFENAIGVMVMSLQYEDIIRQRCEAIIENLENKPSEISEGTWHLFQAKQIETAAEEIRQTTTEIKSGLNDIGAHAESLYQASTTMAQFDHITASADGMVQTLLESLETIRELLQQSTELSEGSRLAMQPVQSLTKELSAIVFEVSIKIQFIALNAQVRSIQVGEGSGLEVLAARTAEISTQLRDLGDETSNKIAELHKTVDELVDTVSNEYEEGKEQLQNVETNGKELEEALHKLRDSTFSSLELVATLTGSVQDYAQNNIQQLSRLTNIAEELVQTATRIRQAANIESLPGREQEKIRREVQTLLEADTGAMHTRLHSRSTDQDAGFDLGISRNAQVRQTSSQTLACDNVEMF